MLSVGQVMAGRPQMTVCSVFAGVPSTPMMQTTYDRDSGFTTASRAITRRRAEDKSALHILGAHARWLDFADHQYGEPARRDDIVAALERVVAEVQPTLILGPLGLAHPDHHTTRWAFACLAERTGIEAWAYEDLPSRVLWPEEVPEALAWWRAAGRRPELGFIGTGPLERKQKALARYSSQLWALTALNEHCCFAPERLHRLWPT